MAPLQHYHRRAWCRIIVAGQDVTAKLNPYLISVRIVDKLDGWDECHLELDDRYGQLAIPPDNSVVQVELGWAGQGPNVIPETNPAWPPPGSEKQLAYLPQSPYQFIGFVDSAESGFSRRGGGRRLWVDAKSRMSKGQIKSFARKSFGQGAKKDDPSGGPKIPLSQPFNDIMGKAGLTGSLSPGMAKEARGFWDISASPMHWMATTANQLGGHAKIINGSHVIMFKKDEQIAPTVEAEWGINLISWRIKPFVGRGQFGQAKSDFFDIGKGSWMDSVKGMGGGGAPFGGASAILQGAAAAANQTTADQTNDGGAQASGAKKGGGWLIVNGEPNARAGGRVTLTGARPGVDGSYRNHEVEHNYSRRGFTTRIDVDMPALNTSQYAAMGWPTSGATNSAVYTPTPQQAISNAGSGDLTFPEDSNVTIGDVEITPGRPQQ